MIPFGIGVGSVLRCPIDLRKLRKYTHMDVQYCPSRSCSYAIDGLTLHSSYEARTHRKASSATGLEARIISYHNIVSYDGKAFVHVHHDGRTTSGDRRRS